MFIEVIGGLLAQSLALLADAGHMLTDVVLLLLAIWILYEAYRRVFEPPYVLGVPMLLIGLVGLAVNVSSIKLLTDEYASSPNVRSAYLEVLSDAINSVGVILGGVTIWLTGWLLIDPLLSAGSSVVVVWRAWSLLLRPCMCSWKACRPTWTPGRSDKRWPAWLG